jgi:uncharacterized membrane protein YdbT with pleckstrin-like domain
MSYADELMSTGEQIGYRTKQHPAIFIWGARYAILALVIVIVLLWFGVSFKPDGVFGTLVGWVTAILFVGGIAVAVWTALRYINQEYVLTNRRVIQVEGVLNRKSTDSSLEKINDAMLKQTFFGRMLDYGDLTVLTASESGIDAMKMLRSPIEFKKRMLDAKHSFEVGMEREGWAPSPPVRPGSPVAATGAAVAQDAAIPAPAPIPAAAPPRVDPDEVTRTLGSLADLRDRGAISPEEYEAKKADLLGRL